VLDNDDLSVIAAKRGITLHLLIPGINKKEIVMGIIQAEHIMNDDLAHLRVDHGPMYAHESAFIMVQYCGMAEAAIRITDTGFIHADAQYDVVRASNGVIIRLADHFERFSQKYICITPKAVDPTAKNFH